MEQIIMPLVLAVVGSTGLWTLINNIVQNHVKKETIERKALQALLRDRLLQAYRFHETKGYCPVDERSSFENMYSSYHNLGANGVMDDIRDKMLDLPTHPERNSNEN